MPTNPLERIQLFGHLERLAVAWLAGHIDCFDPDPESAEECLFRRKALVELALLVAYRVRLGGAPLGEPYGALLDRIESWAKRPSYRHAVARDKKALLLYGLTYAALRICGRDDPAFRTILERAMSTGTATDFERAPFRRLDLIHFLHIGGFQRGGPTFEDVLPFTLIAGAPNVHEMNESDAYAVTHALFYATDFGLRSPSWPAGYDTGAALSLCDALTDHYRRVENADLAAELVASSICLGVPRSPAVDRALAFLLRWQDPSGRVAGPAGFVLHRDPDKSDPRYMAWKESYHTTIVAALVALMCQRAEAGADYPVTRASAPSAPTLPALPRAPRDAAEAAVAWLAAVCLDGDLDDAARAGAGLALCTGMLDAPPPRCRAALASLAARIDAPDAEIDWSALGVDTLLYLEQGMRLLEVQCAAVNEVLREVGTALSSPEVEARPSMVRACHALVEAGVADTRVLDRCLAAARAAPLPEDGPAVGLARSMLSRAAAAEHLALDEEARARIGCSLLGGLSVKLSEYDLVAAAALLRALMLLRLGSDRAVVDAVALLLGQQRPDGAFGYPGETDRPADEERGALLAWTLAVVEALLDVEHARKVGPDNLLAVALPERTERERERPAQNTT